MNADEIIDRLPRELAARLESDPFFNDIPVVVADAGNVKVEMERKQAVAMEKSGKRGAAVIVLQLSANDANPSLAFGPMKLFPGFQVIEDVEMNNDEDGTKKSHRRIARKIRDIIKPAQFIGFIQDMRAGTPCIAPVDLSEIASALKGSQVNFECLEVSTQQQTLVELPAIGQVPGNPPQFTLTCATPGADIWYTLDDSYPWPGTKDDGFAASKSVKYCGPVALPAAASILRACAYVFAEGYVASGVIRSTLVAVPNQQ